MPFPGEILCRGNVDQHAEGSQGGNLGHVPAWGVEAPVPVMENAIQWKRALHLPVVDGAVVNVNQTMDKRPGFRVPGVKGLFLVGDSTAAPGAGGDIGHESVHLAYEEIKRSK